MSIETSLILKFKEGGGSLLPPLTARNCQQSLTPIPNGKLRRTVNGVLVHTGNKGHEKYASTISCKDAQAPAFDGVWQGQTFEVGCLQRLSQPFTGGEQVELLRPAVGGSVVVFDGEGKAHEPQNINGNVVTLPGGVMGGFVSYCPSLVMHVVEFKLETDEWGMTVGWTLKLEEV